MNIHHTKNIDNILSLCSILSLKTMFHFVLQFIAVPFLKTSKCKLGKNWIAAKLHMHSQGADLFMKVKVMRANINLLIYRPVFFTY